MEILFSGTTHVDIQGEHVLTFENVNNKFAAYSLNGFGKYPVKIFDYRNFGLEAINSLLETNQLNDFTPKFNHPAYATITQLDNGEIHTGLWNTDDKNPPHMLWIAIGIKEKIIPDYEFSIKLVQSYENEQKISLFSLYNRPYPDEYPIYYFPSDP